MRCAKIFGLLKIYLPTRLPAGLKLAYIDNPNGSEFATIGFVDAAGNPALKI